MCRKFCFHDFPLEITILSLKSSKIFACGAELDSQLTESRPLEINDSQLSEFPIKWVKVLARDLVANSQLSEFPNKWESTVYNYNSFFLMYPRVSTPQILDFHQMFASSEHSISILKRSCVTIVCVSKSSEQAPEVMLFQKVFSEMSVRLPVPTRSNSQHRS